MNSRIPNNDATEVAKQMFPAIYKMLVEHKSANIKHMNEWCRTVGKPNSMGLDEFKEELKAYYAIRLADVSRAELESAVSEVIASELMRVLSQYFINEEMGEGLE
jgi:hypothetical protein